MTTVLTTVWPLWSLALQRISLGLSGHPAYLSTRAILHPYQRLSKSVGLMEQCTPSHFCWVALEEAVPGIQLELLLVSNHLGREWVFPCHSNTRQAQMFVLFCACICMSVSIHIFASMSACTGGYTCICRYSHTCMYVYNGYTYVCKYECMYGGCTCVYVHTHLYVNVYCAWPWLLTVAS